MCPRLIDSIMDTTTRLLVMAIFVLSCMHGYLTYCALKIQKAKLSTLKKLLFINGLWVINSNNVNAKSQHLIKKGRIVFFLALICLIALTQKNQLF